VALFLAGLPRWSTRPWRALNWRIFAPRMRSVRSRPCPGNGLLAIFFPGARPPIPAQQTRSLGRHPPLRCGGLEAAGRPVAALTDRPSRARDGRGSKQQSSKEDHHGSGSQLHARRKMAPHRQPSGRSRYLNIKGDAFVPAEPSQNERRRPGGPAAGGWRATIVEARVPAWKGGTSKEENHRVLYHSVKLADTPSRPPIYRQPRSNVTGGHALVWSR